MPVRARRLSQGGRRQQKRTSGDHTGSSQSEMAVGLHGRDSEQEPPLSDAEGSHGKVTCRLQKKSQPDRARLTSDPPPRRRR